MQDKFWRLVAFAGVDGFAAIMRLENLAARVHKQNRLHAVNTGLLVIGISFLTVWLAGNLVRPKWLLGFELHASAMLVLALLTTIYRRFSYGVTALRSDWLAVQAITTEQRLHWLRAKIAARAAVELIGISVLAAYLCGMRFGVGVLIFGAGLGLITLILLAHWQLVQQEKSARHVLVSQCDKNHAHARSIDLAITPSKTRDAEPFNAWFSSAIPRLSKLRWWWLIPLLSLPMGSKIMVIAGIFLGFLSLSRFAAVCSAIAIALADISKLTLTTALKPAVLYRAALIFSLQGALILALMATAFALSPAGVGIAIIVGGVGLLLLATALHFGFGYRLQPIRCALRTRASLLIALLLGLTANGMPMLLPIVCVLLWFWLYRRGAHLDNKDLIRS